MPTRTPHRSRRREVFCVFVAVLAVYLVTTLSTSFDSRWALATADSLLHRGDPSLGAFEELITQHEQYGILRVEGRPYDRYPIGPALTALPFVAAIDAFGLHEKIATGGSQNSERRIASVLAALAAAVLYATCRREGYGLLVSLGTAVVFAFGTSAWSTASRALWQHTPTILMLALGHHALVAARTHAWAAALAGLPLAFALIVRPTNAVAVAALAAALALQFPRRLPGFLAVAALVLMPFVAWSLGLFGTPLPPYYSPGGQLMELRGHFLEALAGQFVSPNRGILVFSPVLIFAAAGVVIRIRERRFGWTEAALVLTIGTNPLIVAAAPSWWGGHTYGPRFFTDVLPFVCFFCAPFLAALAGLPAPRRAITAAAFALLLAFSVYVHFRGATDWAVYRWNGTPVNVDDDPSRVWDVSDLQFLRGTRFGADAER
jgi:hypothetical protein